MYALAWRHFFQQWVLETGCLPAHPIQAFARFAVGQTPKPRTKICCDRAEHNFGRFERYALDEVRRPELLAWNSWTRLP